MRAMFLGDASVAFFGLANAAQISNQAGDLRTASAADRFVATTQRIGVLDDVKGFNVKECVRNRGC